MSWPGMGVYRHTVDGDIYGHGLAVGKTDQNIPFAVEYHVALTTDWRIKEYLSNHCWMKERLSSCIRIKSGMMTRASSTERLFMVVRTHH
ncbi:MAG: hypothetical protein PQ968_05225 [Methanobacterium sp.]